MKRRCRGCKNGYPLTSEYFYVYDDNRNYFSVKCKACTDIESQQTVQIEEVRAAKREAIALLEGETLMQCSDCGEHKPRNPQYFHRTKRKDVTYTKVCIACQEAKAAKKAKKLAYHEQLEGFVYFVYDKPYYGMDYWLIKIGWSIVPDERFRAEYKPNGVLLGMVYGIFPDEKSIQDLFAYNTARYHRGRSGMRCEWFFPDDTLLDFIQDVAQLPTKTSIPMMEAKDLKQQLATVRRAQEEKAS
jgi:hypothetical protein